MEPNGEVCFYAHNFIEIDGVSWGYHRPDEGDTLGTVECPDPYCNDSYTVATFNINDAQYEDMVQFIVKKAKQPKDYHFMVNNCVLFVLDVLDHIGVPHKKPLLPFPFFLECVI